MGRSGTEWDEKWDGVGRRVGRSGTEWDGHWTQDTWLPPWCALLLAFAACTGELMLKRGRCALALGEAVLMGGASVQRLGALRR